MQRKLRKNSIHSADTCNCAAVLHSFTGREINMLGKKQRGEKIREHAEEW